MTDLHPDLIACLRRRGGGWRLHHPLLVAQRYVEAHNAVYNREYRGKLAELAQAEAIGNWSRVIWLHEPSFRPMALQNIAGLMTDQQYWPLVSEVWLDSTQTRQPWIALWSAQRSYREKAMTEAEHRMLARLSDMVVIYRGGRTSKVAAGLSWSLHYGDAEAIAFRRGEGRPFIATAQVKKRHIQALFARAKRHHEVVILPRHRSNVRVKARQRRSAA